MVIKIQNLINNTINNVLGGMGKSLRIENPKEDVKQTGVKFNIQMHNNTLIVSFNFLTNYIILPIIFTILFIINNS